MQADPLQFRRPAQSQVCLTRLFCGTLRIEAGLLGLLNAQLGAPWWWSLRIRWSSRLKAAHQSWRHLGEQPGGQRADRGADAEGLRVEVPLGVPCHPSRQHLVTRRLTRSLDRHHRAIGDRRGDRHVAHRLNRRICSPASGSTTAAPGSRCCPVPSTQLATITKLPIDVQRPHRHRHPRRDRRKRARRARQRGRRRRRRRRCRGRRRRSDLGALRHRPPTPTARPVLVFYAFDVQPPVAALVFLVPLLLLLAPFIPPLLLRSAAEDRRREFRLVLSAFLDLVAISLAGGAPYQQAMQDAAAAGNGWIFTELRRPLVAVSDAPTWAPWAPASEMLLVSSSSSGTPSSRPRSRRPSQGGSPPVTSGEGRLASRPADLRGRGRRQTSQRGDVPPSRHAVTRLRGRDRVPGARQRPERPGPVAVGPCSARST